MQVDRLVLGLSFKAAVYYDAHVLEGSLSADISGKHRCDDPRTLPTTPPIRAYGQLPNTFETPPGQPSLTKVMQPVPVGHATTV